MKRIAFVVLLLSWLTACASHGGGTQQSPPLPRTSADPADTFLAVIGTPFLWAVKVPVCVVSAVIAAPIAGAASMATNGQETTRALRDGVKQNCGPPWAFEP
jgi:hypothetical protein